jgi:hypothetical protein
MIQFGAGALYGTPTHDGAGSAITTPTPIKFGSMQEVGVDMSFDAKKLYGAMQFPLAVARGKGSLSFKAKMADIDGRVLSDLFFGHTAAAGIKSTVNGFAAAIPATPFTITVAPPNSGTFVADLGVIDASTGKPLTRVGAAPATGQYMVSAVGLYTFAAADTLKNVLISYEYSAVSTTALYGVISNQLMGASPFFGVTLNNAYQGRVLTLKFNRCMSSKFSMPFKNEDFAIPDFEFEAMADDAGNVGYWAIS